MTDDYTGRKVDEMCFCDFSISFFCQPVENLSFVSFKVGSCITFEFLEETDPDGQDSNLDGLPGLSQGCWNHDVCAEALAVSSVFGGVGPRIPGLSKPTRHHNYSSVHA